MANELILATSTRVGTQQLCAGLLFDLSSPLVAKIESAGGLFWPASDAQVAAAAAIARSLKGRGRGPEDAQTVVMAAVEQASQKVRPRLAVPADNNVVLAPFDYVEWNAAAGNFALLLPPATSMLRGAALTFVNIGASGILTVNGNGTNIADAATKAWTAAADTIFTLILGVTVWRIHGTAAD